MTEQLVAEIFGISQSARSKIKDKIEPALDEATGLSELPPDELVTNRQIVVDGTYVPTGNRS